MLTHIRLSKEINSAIENILPSTYFKNKSEFIRDAVRKSIEDYELKKALKKLQGSSKGFAPTKSQRKALFLEFEKEFINSLEKQQE